MQMYQRLLLLLGFLSLYPILEMRAQDPIYSQYFANPMYLNPALTGLKGGAQLNLNSRKLRYKAGSFLSNGISASINIPCIQSAFGLIYNENRSGDGPVKWQHAGLSWAWYAVPSNSPNDNWDIRFGLTGSYNQRLVDLDNFVFSDQLHAIYGYTGPSQLDLSVFGGNNAFFDLDAGVDFWGEIGGAFSNNVGFTANHLVRADQSLLNTNDTLAIRYTAYWQGIIRTGNNKNSYWIIPMAKVDRQRASRQWRLRDPGLNIDTTFKADQLWRLTYGVLFGLRPRKQDSRKEALGMWGGLLISNSRFFRYFNPQDINTLTVLFGFSWENRQSNWNLGLSYDYDYSGTRSDTGGIFELSLGIDFPQASIFCKSSSQRIRKKCPVPTTRGPKKLYHNK